MTSMQLPGTPYRILRAVGAGGMAEVYLASEQLLQGVQRLVVLKRLMPQHRDDDEFVTMFFDEARICARLQHPHIAELRAAFTCESDHYIAFEHVDGVTLRQLLAAAQQRPERVVPAEQAAGIALTLAETLHYVHTLRDAHGRPLQIVHRDLNPANVVISRAGAVKLIDFGIARAEVSVHETATGMLKGTAGYMAPEQLQEGSEVDARTDIFTFGVLLYELFVGTHPFYTKNPLDAYDLILHSRFAEPRSVRSELPAGLGELVVRCLAAAPERRPRDMREVVESLSALLREARQVPTLTALGALVRLLFSAADDAQQRSAASVYSSSERAADTLVQPRRPDTKGSG
jgi:serine/threonine protein kinase